MGAVFESGMTLRVQIGLKPTRPIWISNEHLVVLRERERTEVSSDFLNRGNELTAQIAGVIQLLIAYWEDNDLQSWLEKCAFGKLPNSPPWTAGKQHEGFEKALKAVGLQVEGAKE